ncbi:hypothetical protein ACFSCZ_05160 [Siminovitchia sediminis]|uniref:Uncharacterized protein n=1 Tax=Siminovitchia sediminis TaxID=1274353 RepID=A0ABW4KD77_9BACI
MNDKHECKNGRNHSVLQTWISYKDFQLLPEFREADNDFPKS